MEWKHNLLESGFKFFIWHEVNQPCIRPSIFGILSIYNSTLSSSAVMPYSSDYVEGTDIFRFLKLDSDGNLKIYSAARGMETL